MNFRTWYKFEGKLDSCIVSAKTKAEAKQIMKDALPSAQIGLITSIQKEEPKRKKRSMEINTDGLL